MKKENEVIKKILIAARDDLFKRGEQFQLKDIDNDVLEYHIFLLTDDQCIDVGSKTTLSTGEQVFFDIKLTSKGQKLLATLIEK